MTQTLLRIAHRTGVTQAPSRRRLKVPNESGDCGWLSTDSSMTRALSLSGYPSFRERLAESAARRGPRGRGPGRWRLKTRREAEVLASGPRLPHAFWWGLRGGREVAARHLPVTFERLPSAGKPGWGRTPLVGGSALTARVLEGRARPPSFLPCFLLRLAIFDSTRTAKLTQSTGVVTTSGGSPS